MDKHQEILITAIRESCLTAREISVRAGVHESTISKFLDGKNDLKAGVNLNSPDQISTILDAMPTAVNYAKKISSQNSSEDKTEGAD